MTTSHTADATETGRFRDNWRRMLGFGSLFIAVTGVVMLGALLRTSPPTAADPPRPASAPSPAEKQAPRIAAPPVERSPIQAAPIDALARRASADIDRLAGSGHTWTAQLAMLCDPAGATEFLERRADDPRLYLLPAIHGESACIRVCWGHYASRDAAKQADDLPAALRAMQNDPLPKAIREILE